jgi:hypothetical protein
MPHRRCGWSPKPAPAGGARQRWRAPPIDGEKPEMPRVAASHGHGRPHPSRRRTCAREFTSIPPARINRLPDKLGWMEHLSRAPYRFRYRVRHCTYPHAASDRIRHVAQPLVGAARTAEGLPRQPPPAVSLYSSHSGAPARGLGFASTRRIARAVAILRSIRDQFTW